MSALSGASRSPFGYRDETRFDAAVRDSFEIAGARVRQPGGALAIAVPSTMSLWSAQLGLTAYRVLGREKVLRIPPYHLMEFVPSTLRRTMETAGFEVVRIRVGAVPISRMGLRGSPIENSGKVALQLAAHATSRALNRWGDRILALGRRPGL